MVYKYLKHLRKFRVKAYTILDKGSIDKIKYLY